MLLPSLSYSLVGSVKQEADNATKSDGFSLRFSRFTKFTTWLVQRSSQAKLISTAGNFAIHTGLMDAIPQSCLSVFLLFTAEFSFHNLGNSKLLLDRLWARENQLVVEISGNTHGFMHSYVASLRLAISITFLLVSLLSSISSSSSSTSASVLLTLQSCTSFLVDICEAHSGVSTTGMLCTRELRLLVLRHLPSLLCKASSIM